MVFSEYILKYPYTLVWWISKLFRRKKLIIFYCDNILDYICFKNDLKHLPEVKVIAKNKKVQAELLNYNIQAGLYPSFPDALIMVRHSLHKFPMKKIYKIGATHGVYNFKKLIAAEKYNRFNAYFMTSKKEIENIKHLGFKTLHSCSFPKIDDLFDVEKIEEFKQYRKKFDERKIILFSATWDKSGISAIEKWHNKLDKLSDKYNIFVTLHPWMSEHYIQEMKKNKNINYIESPDINKYLYISDYLVGDTSSIIGEFCTLKRPIITFKIAQKNRLGQELIDMLDDLSYRIDEFEEIELVIENIEKNGDLKQNIYNKYIELMLDLPLGNNGEKRAKMIKKLLNENL